METLDPDPRSSSPLDPLDERVLQPMKWGLVPSWRNAGQSKSHSPLLNNCRLEGMLEKPSFRSAVEKRRRCVVVADGYAGIDTIDYVHGIGNCKLTLYIRVVPC